MRSLIIGMACLGTLGIAQTASAQTVYDWNSTEVPVLVQDSGTVYFIGKDKTVWRVYKWAASKGTNKSEAFFTDINGDGKADVVGAGKPSFGLDHDSNPIWFQTAGCDQLLTADFTLDEKKDFVCLKGKTLSARTWDWQEAWSISLGTSWEWCVAGDINGDLKADIECKIRGSKKYSRIDGSSGAMLAAQADAPEVTDPKVPSVEPVSGDVLEGKTSFDIDKDGTSEETLVVDGDAVAIKSKSKKVALGRIELGGAPVAAIVKDLDGDKKLEVIAVSAKTIGIWSVGDKEARTFPLSSAKYKRAPVAELQSVYANGFEDDAAAKKVVEDLNPKLDACYASQVKKNQFAGVGRTLLEVQVAPTGKVSKVEMHHSSLADKNVVSCAQNVLKGGKYPKASGDSASVNVTLVYTFRDK